AVTYGGRGKKATCAATGLRSRLPASKPETKGPKRLTEYSALLLTASVRLTRQPSAGSSTNCSRGPQRPSLRAREVLVGPDHISAGLPRKWTETYGSSPTTQLLWPGSMENKSPASGDRGVGLRWRMRRLLRSMSRRK